MSVRAVLGGLIVAGFCLALGIAFLFALNQLLYPALFAAPFCRFWLWLSLSIGVIWTGWHCRRRAMLHGVLVGLVGLFLVLLVILWLAPALLPQKPGWDLALLFIITVVGGSLGEALNKYFGPYWRRRRTPKPPAPPPDEDVQKEEIPPEIEE